MRRALPPLPPNATAQDYRARFITLIEERRTALHALQVEATVDASPPVLETAAFALDDATQRVLEGFHDLDSVAVTVAILRHEAASPEVVFGLLDGDTFGAVLPFPIAEHYAKIHGVAGDSARSILDRIERGGDQ